MSDSTGNSTQTRITEAVSKAVSEALAQDKGDRQVIVQESMERVMAALRHDNVGWMKLTGGLGLDQLDDGFSLEDLKEWDARIREAFVGSPWIGRGAKLRGNFVMDGGIHREGLDSADGRTSNAKVRGYVEDPINQANFFGHDAKLIIERANYTAGQAFIVGDERNHQVRQIPLSQIVAELRNPEFPDEVWAYKREYQTQVGDKLETKSEWIWRNLYWSERKDFIQVGGGKREEVSKTRRMFGRPVNGLTGWGYGSPDAIAAFIWVEIYRDAMMNGTVMNDAMASLAFTVTSTTKQAADNAAIVIDGMGGSGGTASMGNGNVLAPVGTAGKGYDFINLQPLLAAAAAALEVSVVALSSNPAAAGGSYASASTLNLPDKLAVESRRQFHIQLENEVLAWMGAKDVRVWFDTLDDATEIYRKVQALVLAFNMGLFEGTPIAEQVIKAFDWKYAVNIPEGMMLPNNEKSIARSDVDTDGSGVNNQAGGAGQGTSNGTGGQGGSLGGDIAENVNRIMGMIAQENLTEKIQELIDRLDSRA